MTTGGFDVVVLAGGRSRRMGHDKATLVVAGQRLVDLVVARFAPVAERVIVARGDRPLGTTDEVSDDVTGLPDLAGPLAGVVAGLRAASSSHVALVPVDAPGTSPALVQRLVVICARTNAPAVVPVADGHLQPLHAVFDRTVLPTVEALAGAGEVSTRHLLVQLAAHRLDVEAWGDIDPAGSFADDWDEPADLPPGVSLGEG